MDSFFLRRGCGGRGEGGGETGNTSQSRSGIERDEGGRRGGAHAQSRKLAHLKDVRPRHYPQEVPRLVHDRKAVDFVRQHHPGGLPYPGVRPDAHGGRAHHLGDLGGRKVVLVVPPRQQWPEVVPGYDAHNLVLLVHDGDPLDPLLLQEPPALLEGEIAPDPRQRAHRGHDVLHLIVRLDELHAVQVIVRVDLRAGLGLLRLPASPATAALRAALELGTHTSTTSTTEEKTRRGAPAHKVDGSRPAQVPLVPAARQDMAALRRHDQTHRGCTQGAEGFARPLVPEGPRGDFVMPGHCRQDIFTARDSRQDRSMAGLLW